MFWHKQIVEHFRCYTSYGFYMMCRTGVTGKLIPPRTTSSGVCFGV